MRKIFVAFVVTLILTGSLLHPAVIRVGSAQTEVALLIDPEGDVRVQRGRRTHSVREDMLLNVGDVVTVNGNGTGVIYQAYVPVKRLRANERFNVVRRSPPPPPPERALTSEEFTWFKVHYTAARRNRRNPSPVTLGGPEDAPLTLLEPRNSVVLLQRPVFIWSRVPNATKYLFSVYDRNEAVICTKSTSETRLTLPDNCIALEPGDYKWDVTAQVGNRVSDNSALYDATSFIVVPARRAAEISAVMEHGRAVAASGESAAISVYVSALLQSKLYPQAEAELRRALEQSPKDQVLWALLIETYAQMKRWRAREKAREISGRNPTTELVRTLEVGR
jgi:hypothetical protein